LNFVISEHSPIVNSEYVGIPRPQQQHRVCPYCRGAVDGIKMMPLVLSDLDRAVELRKQSVQLLEQEPNPNGKRAREEESQYLAAEAESSFLLLSKISLGSGGTDRAHHRTGRWSTEEVQYVDYIIAAFDQGTLAIPHGVKLNDLLGELLMCKSSRLTKKMKNAKLSTRSYILKAPVQPHCAATLSNLQERFLDSVSSESSQLELRFNMTKLWRTHFSNLCLQVGYELLDAREWITTLEQLEGKASEAEDHIRKARRRRMSLALRTDIGEAANAGVFIGGMSARDANMQPPPTVSSTTATSTSMRKMSSSLVESTNLSTMNTNNNSITNLKREHSEVSMSDSDATKAQVDEDDEFLAALEMTASGGHGSSRSRLASEDMDFGALLADDVDPLSMMPHLEESLDTPSANGGPFLEEVSAYMETHDIPFQYADVWVPSFMGDDGQATSATSDPSKLRLFPAGHATRSDMDPTVRSQLNEFGSYSAHFSFEPGHGLPGRVYANGTPSWETNIHEADPSVFERAGGANVYGIKTAVGVPLVAAGIGRIVVALYSTCDIPCDQVMLNKFVEDFTVWNPEPKWKLVIDIGNSSTTNKRVTEAVVPTEMMHYSHPKAGGDSKPPPVASKSFLGSLIGKSAFESTTVTPPITSTTSTATMVYHCHAPTKPAPETFAALTSAPSSSRTSSIDSTFDDATEQAIASLLGDHMPSNDGPAAALLPHFMSLRLMLLRVAERRSPEENDKLDVLKRSYVDYSKGRSGYELACLLAKDWMFLQPNFGETKPSPQGFATSMPHQQPVPLPAYSLPPAAAAQPTAMRMIVHKHSPPTSSNHCTGPRSRSVSASSESSHLLSADIVPDG
jgi:hypothetical protein